MFKLKTLSKKLKSFVYSNIAVNGNFTNGTNGWGVNTGTLSAANNILTLTGSSTPSCSATNITATPVATNKKLYVNAILETPDADIASFDIVMRGSTSGTTGTQSVGSQATPTANTQYTIKNLITVPATHTGYVMLYARLVHATNITGKVLYVRKVLIVDLTTLFGTGNEPSAADCANIFKFVDGTKQPSLSNVLAT